MLTISRDKVIDILKGGVEPAAYCDSGDKVIFATRDCYDDDLITEETPNGVKEGGMANPATGPLYVNGAMPGDVLKVEILEIWLRGDGVMRTSPTAGAFHHLYKERTARRFHLGKNEETGREGFWFDDRLWLDCDAMIGVIGTAPEGEEGVPTDTPGAHGGNMDCNRITAGSTLYLPVHVPGALLALGDLHARMGDGEVMICGLETAGLVTVQVTVLEADEDERVSMMKGALPLLLGADRTRGDEQDSKGREQDSRGGEQDSDIGDKEGRSKEKGRELMTIQSAPTMDEAALLAAQRMRQLVAGLTGLNDVDSGMLMSLVSDLAVCQIVDPLQTVRCAFPMGVLKQYGVSLP